MTTTHLAARLSENVFTLRVRANLTQKELADRCGLHNGVISRIEPWELLK